MTKVEATSVVLSFGAVEGTGAIELSGEPDADPVRSDERLLEVYGEAAVDEIRALDCIEHFGPEEIPRVLSTWARLLKPGGKLTVRCPDLHEIARKLIKEEISTERFVDLVYGRGTRECPEHLCGFSRQSLREALTVAGFVDFEAGVLSNENNMLLTAWRAPGRPGGSESEERGTVPDSGLLLSVVLPSFAGGATQLARTLHSFAGQTCPYSFEVLVVDDGATGPEVHRVAHQDWGFAVRYLVSPRPTQPDLAHKNHARNVGWRHASGELCLVLDADCMAGPHFVESVLAAYAEQEQREGPFVLYPLIVNLNKRFDDWVDRRGDAALGDQFEHMLSEVGFGGEAFGGNYEHRDRRIGATKAIDKHPEGFPVLPKQLIDDLGGFDEAFLAWGGNKEEFQQRINEIPEIRKYLLTSAVVYHQPHGRDRGNRKASGNAGLMNRKRADRKKDQLWLNRVKRITRPAADPDACGEAVSGWLRDGCQSLETVAPEASDRRITRIKLSQRLPAEKVLFVGPWVGEFGWQIARWQGGVRRRCEQSEAYVIVMGDPGCHHLYEFADEYWWTPSFLGRTDLVRDQLEWRPTKQTGEIKAALRCAAALELARIGLPVDVLEPRRFLPAEQSHRLLQTSSEAELEREVLLSHLTSSEGWVCLFPRKRALNPQKNWAVENWRELAERLHESRGLNMVVLGGNADTAALGLDPAWSIDLTHLPLERRLGLGIAFLSEARLAIGSECGGILLSLACGTPTVVMGGPHFEKRVTREENYQNAPCQYLASPDYQHTLAGVEEAVESMLRQQHPAAPVQQQVRVAEPEKLGPRLRTDGEAAAVLEVISALPHVKPEDRNRGWFKSRNYYPCYHAIASVVRPTSVMEVGTRLGYSLVALVTGHPSTTRVVSIDNQSEIPNSRTLSLENLRATGFTGDADFMAADSMEMLDALQPYERFDLIHLDCDVCESRSRAGIELAWKLVAPGGVLLVDDIDYLPEVGAAFEGLRGRLRHVAVSERLETFRGLGILRKRPLPSVQAPEDGPPGAYTCILCDSDTSPFAAASDLPVQECEACGLVQTVFGTDEERKRWASLYEATGTYHRTRQMAGYTSYSHRYLHDRQLARIRLENLMRFVEQPGTLLDVGCSNGAFVRTAEDYGFAAEGIDLDEWVVETARTVTGCRLSAADPLDWHSQAKYDVITVLDTLEHFHSPIETLAHLRQMLAPHGLLVAEMPDATEPGFARLRTEWRHFKPREHAFYYGRSHTEKLLDAAGFEVIDSIVPFPDRRIYYARQASS